MKKNRPVLFSAALAAFFSAAPLVQADTAVPSTAPVPASAPMSASKSDAGTVQSIDLTNNNVLIKDENGNERTLRITSGTTIQRNGSSASVADLKDGDLVTINNGNRVF